MTETSERAGPEHRHADRDGGWPQLTALVLSITITVLTMILTWPQLARLSTDFHAPVSSVAWTSIITFLVGTPVGAITAGVGLFRGNRLMLILSLSAILVGSVVAVFADSLAVLIVARGIQGLGVGLMSLAMGIVAVFWSGRKLRQALSLCVAGASVGGVITYVASAVLGDADWHILFYMVAALAAVSLALVLLFVKETPRRKAVHVDLAGAVGLLAGTTLVLLPLSQANHWGWSSGQTLGMLGAGIAALVFWCAWELRSPWPLLDLRVLAKSGVWQAAVLWSSLSLVGAGWAVLNPYLIQTPNALGGYGLGRSILVVSLIGLVVFAISAGVAPAIPALMRAIGTKSTLFLAAASGLVFFGMAGAHSALWVLFVWAVVYAFASAWGGAVFTVAAEAVPPEMAVIATGIITGVARASGAVGSALIGFVLTLRSNSFEVQDGTISGMVTVPAAETFTWAMLVLGGIAVASVLVVLSVRPARRSVAMPPGRTD